MVGEKWLVRIIESKVTQIRNVYNYVVTGY